MSNQMNDFARQQPLLVALVLAVIAFFIGWMLMGWVIWPVEYVDGNVAQLRDGERQEYVRLVAAAYALEPNLELARQRIQRLGPDAAEVISSTVAASTGSDVQRVQQLQLVMQAAGGFGEAAAPQPSALQRFGLPLACGLLAVMLVIGGGTLLYLRSSGMTRASAGGSMASPGRPVIRPRPVMEVDSGAGAPAAMASPTGGPPISQFMTTYVLGDDLYDDSFSIDGPDGNFLGECGMGISETIGVGDPKKVMVFEVWLFDKNDIRTVTKVLMSEHAFRDEALKSRLAAKGEPVQVKTGDVVTMDTATLTVTARVVDMAYGGGALPPNSFFERLTIELAAYQKQPAA